MVIKLLPPPDGYCAILADEQGDELEVPIVAICLHDTGEITAAAYSEKQKRYGDDVTDDLFFPGFSGFGFMTDEGDDGEPQEDDEETEIGDEADEAGDLK